MSVPDKTLFYVDGICDVLYSLEQIRGFIDSKLVKPNAIIHRSDGQAVRADSLIIDNATEVSKHPLDRPVFFTPKSDTFFSVNEIQTLVQTGRFAMADCVFDTGGERYTAGSIAKGQAPEWAVENDPMESGLPPLAESDIALADELASEDGFLEMPPEPATKSVKTFLSREPQIAKLVAQIPTR